MRAGKPRIELLYFAGCPNREPTRDLAREVLRELGLDVELIEIAVETAEAAEAQRFVGSPSVRVNGEDIEPEARARTDFALSCRVYGRRGVPPKALLERALRKASSR